MFGWFRKNKNKPKLHTEFDHIMDFACSIASKNPVALINMVRVLLRPLQSELLLTAIQNEMHQAQHEIESYKFFMPNGPSQLQMDFDEPKLDAANFLVQLNCDPVLPCPWHRDRYVDNLGYIGKDKARGPWKEDSLNHRITIWLPWGIAFVHGGNHSISTGILNGEGTVKPKEVYNMARLLGHVQCDGTHYRDTKSGAILDSVHDYKIAAVFEIGRLMKLHQITPMKIQI